MWTIADYQPVTLFSLRPANATTSGGKTLLTPTPFALKMALLDVAIRRYGKAQGEAWFPRLRDLEIAVQLPEHLMVINTFIKILRPHKGKAKDTFGTGIVGEMGNTISYREMVQFAGPIRLALRDAGPRGEEPPLETLLPQINYLGKRGGFFQFSALTRIGEKPSTFTLLTAPAEGTLLLRSGTMQLLDDCGPKMSFSHADVFEGKSTLAINKANGRILRPVIMPYRLHSSSRGYTRYELLE